jgi:hypothetical protein
MCAVTTQFIKNKKKGGCLKGQHAKKDVEKCTFQNTSTLLKWSEKKGGLDLRNCEDLKSYFFKQNVASIKDGTYNILIKL